MTICIYDGLNNYEDLWGVIIEWCKTYGHQLDIYTRKNNQIWASHYKVTTLKISDFKAVSYQYDIIINFNLDLWFQNNYCHLFNIHSRLLILKPFNISYVWHDTTHHNDAVLIDGESLYDCDLTQYQCVVVGKNILSQYWKYHCCHGIYIPEVGTYIRPKGGNTRLDDVAKSRGLKIIGDSFEFDSRITFDQLVRKTYPHLFVEELLSKTIHLDNESVSWKKYHSDIVYDGDKNAKWYFGPEYVCLRNIESLTDKNNPCLTDPYDSNNRLRAICTGIIDPYTYKLTLKPQSDVITIMLVIMLIAVLFFLLPSYYLRPYL